MNAKPTRLFPVEIEQTNCNLDIITSSVIGLWPSGGKEFELRKAGDHATAGSNYSRNFFKCVNWRHIRWVLDK